MWEIALISLSTPRYGGIYETEAREYTLDDFYTLNLEKRDGYVTLRASGIDEETWQGSDDGDSEGEDGDEDDEDASDSDEDEDEEVEDMIDAAEQDGEGEGHDAMTAAEKVRTARREPTLQLKAIFADRIARQSQQVHGFAQGDFSISRRDPYHPSTWRDSSGLL